MAFVGRYFLRGLAVVVPIAVTAWVIWQIFTGLDRLIDAPYPGLGLAITLAGIILIGLLVSNIVGRTFVRMTDALFGRAPLVKIIYTSVKDLVDAFVGERRRFDRPVRVDLTLDGAVQAVGFVTRDEAELLQLPGHSVVYFPQSYNFAGNVVLVQRERLHAVEADSAQVMAFIVSGGVSGGKAAAS